MERATGFEPATSTLARLRATNCAKPASQELLYATLGKDASTFFKKICLALKKGHIQAYQGRGTPYLWS